MPPFQKWSNLWPTFISKTMTAAEAKLLVETVEERVSRYRWVSSS